MKKVDWQDSDGINRRSMLPDDSNEKPEVGIPIDAYAILDDILADTPIVFRQKLYNGLWQRGLIEPSHFSKRTAQKDVRQALQQAISNDASDIINHILGVSNNVQK